MKTRRDLKQTQSFEERLIEQAMRLKEAAAELPLGLARNLLLRRARQVETASHISDWLRSPGVQPPE